MGLRDHTQPPGNTMSGWSQLASLYPDSRLYPAYLEPSHTLINLGIRPGQPAEKKRVDINRT